MIKFQKIVSRLFYAEIGAGESIMDNNPKSGATASVGLPDLDLTNTNKDLREKIKEIQSKKLIPEKRKKVGKNYRIYEKKTKKSKPAQLKPSVKLKVSITTVPTSGRRPQWIYQI